MSKYIDGEDLVGVALVVMLIAMGIAGVICSTIENTKVKVACIEAGGTYKSGTCQLDNNNR